ncbi:hypothetical protein BJV78DRAFT_490321 [Lactifluus subvellereus]|nr:hypothetical protein BJV78DRAFT_490321 [Lactifluus subvellereus]
MLHMRCTSCLPRILRVRPVGTAHCWPDRRVTLTPFYVLLSLPKLTYGDVTQGSPSEADSANEAARAYKQALATLATLTSLPSSRSFETPHQLSWHTGNSILSSLLPNPQGQGPLGSAFE